MAVSSQDLAAGTLALQVFIKNVQYVEMIVNVAFGAIPSILGIGAAGLIGSGVINTAREVMHSISLFRVLDRLRFRFPKGDDTPPGGGGGGGGSGGPPPVPPPEKKQKQQTQSEGEEEGGGGGGGPPPVPPDIKSSEQNNKTEKPQPIHPSYGLPNPFKKKK